MPSFATLKTRVKDYLIDVPSKTDTLVGDWINFAIVQAEEDYNFKHMEAEQSYTTTTDDRVLSNSLPDGWKSLREPPYYVRNDDFSTIQELGHATSLGDMRRKYADGDDGAPDFLLFSEADDQILVLPTPDGGSDYNDGEFRITVPYWKYSDALADDADTNWFTDNAEWYLVFFAAAEGFLFNRDHTEAQIWLERAKAQLLQKVNTQKQTKRRLPRMVVPRRDVYATSRQPPRK